MKKAALGIVLALLCLTDSVAGLRQRCRQECGSTIDDCVTTTGRRARCVKQVIKRCRRQGLTVCGVFPTTTTTTTIPPCISQCNGTCCRDPEYPVCVMPGSPRDPNGQSSCCSWRDGNDRPATYCPAKPGESNGYCCPADYPLCEVPGRDPGCYSCSILFHPSPPCPF
jgi:hypothetical protein